jgi:transposase
VVIDPTRASLAPCALESRPRVRAKITAAKPGPGVLIALSGAVSTVEVTSVLTGLLEALNGVGKARAPSRRPHRSGVRRRPRRRSGPARGTTGGRGGSNGKLAGKEAAIIERYKAGESCRAISHDYDCSDMAIRYLLKRNGVELRTSGDTQRGQARRGRRALTEEQAQQCAELYKAGDSMRTIADDFGISENGVRVTLQRLGVPSRPARRPAAQTTTEGKS